MAVARGDQKASMLRVVRRPRRALMASTALQAAFVIVLAAPAVAQPAPNAQPSLGRVSAGGATVTQSATTTTVTQTTARAALNWQSFDVGAQQTVTFAQPNASSIALNRVTGPNPSQIAGRIDANGQIALVNQSGVVFYKGAQVNAQSVIVSAAGITDQNFMAGKMVFDQAPNPNARVENQGQITVKQAGLAALVAPQVANSGTITAKLGHVILAGVETHTLDLYGDGLLSIDVTGQVKQAPVGPDGKPVTALVTNTGTVIAAGGTVLLTAQAADGLVRNLVSAGGRIAAPTVGAQTGTVEVTATGGSATVTGSLSAAGRAAGTKGGQVQVSASDTVTLATGSRISVSGKAGGGTVALGTTLARAKGGGTGTAAANTKNVVIQKGATVSASATANGNGGRVVLLSTNSTTMAGTISAKGGAAGGDGGFAEVSGGTVTLAGHVDATAPIGATGTLLLDPSDLWVSDVKPSAATSWVSPTTLEGENANIKLTTSGNLNVATSFDTTNTLDLGSHTLTLTSGGGLTIDRGFTINASTISLTAYTGSITLDGASGVAGGIITGPQLAGLSDTAITGTTLTMSGAFGITLGGAKLGTEPDPLTRLDLSTSLYGVTQDAGGAIYASQLGGASDVAGAVKLLGSANQIATIGTFVAGNGFTLNDAAATLTVSGPVNGGSGIAITNTGSLVLDANLIATGTVALNAVGIAQNSGAAITAAVLTGTAGSGSAIFDGANSVARLGAFSAQGGFALFDDVASLTVTGAISGGPGGVYLINAGSLVIDAKLTSTGTVDLIANGITQDSAGIITAGTLTGDAGTGAARLDIATNVVTALSAFSAAQGFALRDDVPVLTVSKGVSGGTATDIVNTGSVVITGPVVAAAGVVDLVGDGITQTSGGTIVAGTLTGSAGAAHLGVAKNDVKNLGSFTAAQGFGLNDNVTLLTVTGPVDGGASVHLVNTGSLAIAAPVSASGIVDLAADGITQDTAGTITAGTLTGDAGAGAAHLGVAVNKVTNLGTFTADGGFGLNDDKPVLTVIGPVSGGASVHLVNTGSLVIDAGITATDVVSLTANGISQSASGVITTGTLTGDAHAGAAHLGVALNKVTNLGTFTATGGFGLNDGKPVLTVIGPVNGGPSVHLVNTGSLVIDAGITAADVVSLSADGIAQSSAGVISTDTLTGNARAYSANLGTALNKVVNLGTFTANGGFGLNDDKPVLTVTGPVSGGPSVHLLNTGSLVIDAGITATDVVSLSANGITQSSAGVISAGTLTGDAHAGAAHLGVAVNKVANLGTFSAKGGFGLNDEESTLKVIGLVNGYPSVHLVNTGSVVIDAGITAADIVSLSANGITQSSAGVISTDTLTGDAGSGAANLGVADNAVDDLAKFTAAEGFGFRDTKPLTITGPVDGGPSVSVGDTGGALTIAGDITATGAVDLTTTGAGGGVMQTGGSITAGTLQSTGDVTGGADFDSPTNKISNLGKFTAKGGDFKLADSVELTIVGAVAATKSDATIAITDSASPVSPAPAIGFTSDGSLTAGALVSPSLILHDGTVDLSTTGTGGNITESAGAIVAGTLKSTHGVTGGVDFSSKSNVISKLGSFKATGGSFTLMDATALTINGAVGSCDGNVIIKTSGTTAPGIYSAITVAAGALVYSLDGTVTMTAAGDFVQTGGLINAPAVTIESQHGNIAQSGGTIAAIDTIAITSDKGSFTQSGTATIAANGDITVDAATGIILNDGTILSAKDITLGSGAGISQTAGTVAANFNLTLGGTMPGSYTVDDITQTAGLLSSGATLTLRAGNNLSQSDAGTTYANELDSDASVGDNDFGLTSGPASVTAGPDQIVCPCTPKIVTRPGPPAQAITPKPNGLPSEIILRGGTVTIDKTERTTADGTVLIIAHGSPTNTNPGNIKEVSGGLIQTGTLTGEAQRLGGASLGDLDPSIQNLIGTLSNFTTDGNFVLTDAESLAVTGAVAVGQALVGAVPPPAAVVNLASITVQGALTVDLGASIISGGTLPVPATPSASLYPGGNVTLVAQDNTTVDHKAGGKISISGKVAAIAGKSGGGTVTLDADQMINEPTGTSAPGQIIAGTLTGAAGRDNEPVTADLPQSVTLNSQTNQIDQLGAFLALGDFKLTDYPNVTPNPTQTLTVIGAVQVGNGHTLDIIAPSLALAATGSLTADAVVPTTGATPYAVTPGLIVLQADAMSLRLGTVTAGDGTVAIAPLNKAALAGGVVLSLDPTTVAGHLSLTQADLSAIHTIGTLGTNNGPLGTQTLVLGSLDGATPSATAASVQINTGINLTGVASTLALFSTTDIKEAASGAVTAHALTASAPSGNIYLNGANAFAQTGNVATIGAYTTAGTSAIGNVTASGNVLIGNSRDLTVLTTVQAAGYAEIDVLQSGGAPSGNLTVAGLVEGADAYLRAGNQGTAGSVTIATGGSVTASGLVDLAAGVQYTAATPSSAPVAGGGPGASSGGVTIAGSIAAGAAGLYAADTITGTGSITAGTLTGSSGAATSLTGANQVGQLGNFTAAGGFTMDDGQTLAIAGALSGGPSATVTVTNGDLGVTGSVEAGAVALNAGNITVSGAVGATTATLTAGDLITVGGTLDGSSSVQLSAGGNITETGSLTVGTLSGSTPAGASLTGANTVADLGGFAAGTGFTLNDTPALTVTGTVNGGPSVTIADAGALTVGAAGSLTGTTVTLSGSSIGIAGAVDGPTSVALTAGSGGITEGGSLHTALLSGSAATATSLTGTNAIAVLGNFSSATGLSLTDGTGLTVTGTVTGGPAITLSINGPLTVDGSLTAGTVAVTAAGNITSPGSIVDGNSVSLVSTGGTISQTGLLVADTLTGSAAGSANFTGATASTDQVGTLGSFTVTGGSSLFTLNDGTNLLIGGPVSANTIVINDGSNLVTLGNGAQIATGGSTRPGGVNITLPSVTGGNSGAYIAAGSFTQTGSSSIAGAPSILSIDVQPGGGNIQFDTSRGLQAADTWLVLQLGGGHASGNIFVKSLDLAFSGSGGGSTLTGTVGGVGGQTAAAGSDIAPRPNASYLLNSCAIHSVNCVILPSYGVPTADPLNNFDLSTGSNSEEQDELWLPIVSGQDY